MSIKLTKQNGCVSNTDYSKVARMVRAVKMLRVPLSEIAKKGIEK